MKSLSRFMTIMVVMSSSIAFGQQVSFETNSQWVMQESPGWVRVNPIASIKQDQWQQAGRELLKLPSDNTFEKVGSDTESNGMTHDHYVQKHDGIEIFGTDIRVHSIHGKITTVNGKWLSGLTTPVQATLSGKQAEALALEAVHARMYMWEDQGMETLLKRIRQDNAASYRPDPQLVFFDPDFSGDASKYRLAWKVEVYAADPLSREQLFIDAQTGQVIDRINMICTDNANGVAETMYSGTVNFVTDSIASDTFRLREIRDGVSIETYDLNRDYLYGNAVDFYDDDNYWNNVNAQKDQAAPDGHWGAEMTHDYYMQYHNRNSYNDKGFPMISYIHYRTGYQNAFWNGEFMTYGDGSGNSRPFDALDVCGHEFTHGVTQFSAGLIYKDESGALNESFSDIFGYMVQWYGDTANWDVGEDIGALRDMHNPHKFLNPDTYLGQYWHTTQDDEGGVHTNSGVQNYWFYLLTDGDTGTNDNGRKYKVTGIGREKAAAIAYRNLTVYLGKTSQYADARQGAIWAAEDLFGPCSEEMRQTAMAWYAVGVGDSLKNVDLSAVELWAGPSSCHLTDTETVTILIKNTGCQPVTSGDTLYAGYRMNGGSAMNDTLVMVADFNPGDTIFHAFNTTQDLTLPGTYTFDAWVNLNADEITANDSVRQVTVERWKDQNDDFGVTSMLAPGVECGLTASEDVTVEVVFEGCDSIPAGTEIPLGFQVNGGTPTRDTLVLQQSLAGGEVVQHTFSNKASLTGGTAFALIAWSDFPGDSDASNDTSDVKWVFRPVKLRDNMITFEDTANVVDSFFVVTQPRCRAYVSDTSVASGNQAFQMTGSEFSAIRKTYFFPRPTDLNTWTVNDAYRSDMCVCVDATNWTTANVTFNLRQTFNGLYSSEAGGLFPYTSSMRILVNGVPLEEQYNAETRTSDGFKFHHVNLDAFAGTQFELCFEAKTYEGLSAEKYPALYKGDNVFIDDINVTEKVNVGTLDLSVEDINIAVYPNPAQDAFYWSLSSPRPVNGSVTVTNMVGEVVYVYDLAVASGEAWQQVDAHTWAPGLYLIRFETPEGASVRKLAVN
ncbi:MAG: M4 family metallopeptidase [Flavobacteriales bacterium]|nr:M4 family metallopeptidase [Flavobacteriales bacterium]MCB9447970.1 M4 family metallopeptidase [Flavobacteriales bacterium]